MNLSARTFARVATRGIDLAKRRFVCRSYKGHQVGVPEVARADADVSSMEDAVLPPNQSRPPTTHPINANICIVPQQPDIRMQS